MLQGDEKAYRRSSLRTKTPAVEESLQQPPNWDKCATHWKEDVSSGAASNTRFLYITKRKLDLSLLARGKRSSAALSTDSFLFLTTLKCALQRETGGLRNNWLEENATGKGRGLRKYITGQMGEELKGNFVDKSRRFSFQAGALPLGSSSRQPCTCCVVLLPFRTTAIGSGNKQWTETAKVLLPLKLSFY